MARARPAPELARQQLEQQERHHRAQAALPFSEKVRQVLLLQKLLWPVLAQQRELKSWERPWDIDG